MRPEGLFLRSGGNSDLERHVSGTGVPSLNTWARQALLLSPLGRHAERRLLS